MKIAPRHGHHYRGFAVTQWRLFERTGEIKPLLYTFRALLTGVHLLRTGEVNAHLPTLLEKLDGPDHLPARIEAKVLGEHRGSPTCRAGSLPNGWRPTSRTGRRSCGPRGRRAISPEHPPAFEAVHEFVVETRLSQCRNRGTSPSSSLPRPRPRRVRARRTTPAAA